MAKASDSSEENWLERLTWRWAGLSFTTQPPVRLAVFDKKHPVVLSDILSNSINNRGSRKKLYEYMKMKNEHAVSSNKYRSEPAVRHTSRREPEDSALKAVERLQRGEKETEQEFRRRKQRLRRLLREEQRRELRRQELQGLRLRHMRRRVLRHQPAYPHERHS